MKSLLYSFVIVVVALSSCTTEYYLPKETTGTYRSIPNYNEYASAYSVYYDGHASYECWTFNAFNIIYIEPDHSFNIGRYWVNGTSCYIRYDLSDPTKFEPVRSKPIFYSDEFTTFTNAKVLKVSKHMIKFCFTEYDIKYVCYQPVDSVVTEFKEGDTIQVEYWNEDPHRAIIIFKNPTYEVHVKKNRL